MSNSACLCNQEDNQEKFQRLAEIIEEYKFKEGSLIQILHFAQGLYGYLSLELQQFIAQQLKMPLSEVSGVVTFYSFFTTQPRGKNIIKVCLGTACYVRGGKKIVDRLKNLLGIEVGETTADGKYTLEVMRCIGACGLAPAIMVNDKVFQRVNPDKLSLILEEFSENEGVNNSAGYVFADK